LDVNAFVVAKPDLSGREVEEMAELSSDQSLTISFKQIALSSSWLWVVDENPSLSQKTTKILLNFNIFSTHTNIKTKCRQVQTYCVT